MDLQVDRTKVYTSGEWVHGTVALSSNHVVKKVTVELRGTLSSPENCKDHTSSKETKLYSIFENIDRNALDTNKQDGGISFNFAIRFPGHESDDFLMHPASILNRCPHAPFEIHHFITVSVLVLVHGLLATTLVQTVELEFMPSVSIGRLLEPNVLYHVPSFGGLPVAANIHLPRFLAQGRVPNTIKIELLNSKKLEYDLVSIMVALNIYITIQGRYVFDHTVGMETKLFPENLIEFFSPGAFDMSPAFSLSGVKLGYEFKLFMTVAESHNQMRHEIVFSKPVDLLPTLLYKSDRLGFARQDEVVAMSKRIGWGLKGSMISTLLGGELDSTTTAPGTVSDNPATDTTSPPKYCEAH